MEAPEPNHSDFWNSCYQAGRTPWDLGRTPSGLSDFFKRRPKNSPAPDKTRVLIPGCGSGYEVKAFAEAGYDFTAIDLAPAAVERARKLVGPRLAGRVVEGDFFQHDLEPGSFDLVYERFFLAALAPNLRAAYLDRMAQLLKYGGSLAGCFYYHKTKPADGPPFGLAWGDVIRRHDEVTD